jgi:membrane protease YdiL (CAAX protease family)
MNKFLQFPIVRIIVAILFIGIAFIVSQVLLNFLRGALSISDTATASILAFLLFTPATYFAYWMYARLIEKRDLTELGLSSAAREFGLGSLIGFGLFAFVVAILWLTGCYRVNGIDFVVLTFIGALAGALISGFVQELIFRAVIYRITEEWLGTWWAVAISAIIFGLIHLSTPGATIFSALAVALQAGVTLAAAYVLTHRLWMALGIHVGWDFANDGVFGVGIAGQTGTSIKGLLQAQLNGPELLTGGSLGVEVSIITLVVMLIAGVVMLRWAYQKSHFVTRKMSSRQGRTSL